MEHSIAFGFHREFYGGMCFVKRVREARCCFYTGHDGERIVNISSIERREFTLSLKVFFDVRHERIPNILLIPPSKVSLIPRFATSSSLYHHLKRQKTRFEWFYHLKTKSQQIL